MNQLNIQSPSLVVNSSQILLLSVESAHFGEWIPHDKEGFQRSANINFKIEEILKGTADKAPGDRFLVSLNQFDRRSLWNLPSSGVWSNQPLTPSQQLLAFCLYDGSAVASMLHEPFCQQVIPAETSLVSVRLILAAEAETLSIISLLERASTLASSLDLTFVDYLADRIDNDIFLEEETFEAVMRFVESPHLPLATRSSLLDAVRRRITASGTANIEKICRLVITLFRLVSLPAAEDLHENIVQVFLPNLLGLRGGARKCDASTIFRDYPEERSLAEARIQSLNGTEVTDMLLNWLH